MPDVIDLSAERDRRFGPDQQFRSTDDAGVPMFLFIGEFPHDNGVWSVNFWAYNFEDAEKRIASMRSGLTVCGQIYSEVEG